MASITITEAFAEVKLIDKKLSKKTKFISSYLVRQSITEDPLESDGGSAKAVAAARQAIDDLHERRIAIRREVQKSNHATMATVAGRTRSVADWLTWRREVSAGQLRLLNSLNTEIQRIRQTSNERMTAAEDDAGKRRESEITVHIDESELHREIEQMDEIIETLDGKLSLLNATTLIDI